MTTPPPFLATLETAAHAADAEETTYRRASTARIATLERARTFAFRRLNVLRAMAEAAGRAPDPDASSAAQLGLIRDRLGWQGAEGETPRAVLDRLTPLAASIDAEVRLATADRPTADAPAAEPISGETCAELDRFESWYAERFGIPFWALFDHDRPDTPVVDF